MTTDLRDLNTSGNDTRVQLEIWSDIACPWCYVGLRHLRTTLASLDPDDQPAVRWRAYQLDATIPEGGVDVETHYTAKFGSMDRLAEMHQRLEIVGEDVGIAFRFDRLRIVSNTLHAHRLIAAARRFDLSDAMAEALFSAYFEQGVNIGDQRSLDEIVNAVALDPDQAEQIIRAASAAPADGADPEIAAGVASDIAAAQQLGISSVPCFVADRAIAVPGAVPPEVLNDLLIEAAKRRSPDDADE